MSKTTVPALGLTSISCYLLITCCDAIMHQTRINKAPLMHMQTQQGFLKGLMHDWEKTTFFFFC